MTSRSVAPNPNETPHHRTPRADPATDQNKEPLDRLAETDVARSIESYERLRAVVTDYRVSSINDDAQLTSMKSRIMEVVRREFARGPSVELTTPAGHTYAMLLAALRAEVRAVVDEQPGVQARRVHALELDQDTMTIDLRLAVTMSSRSSISDLHVRLRAGITDRLRDAAGLRTRTLDLIAEDIYDE